ncbi:MAG: hypothetical protein A3I44_00350 [Candidatus Sungbacteria bacterium RIFCSPLOWO2_02_FULL_51_17]|uniref:Nucleotidyl transferase domain-containing protein n=1 Tax=Candidatus Sungbacteria bacterium RIFCSPHIGHO2_02_FULL_51_29 TaxID=1802273 RepID=A0A1G2KPF2_9BACT|nr:MAG: hypothetical protein A2676_04735 [Candidatus Sungbacteria bacterium RIFCSPHIGHO2_01_FULL_51_22]OHA01288.1 MAG: hypothetical protein A3C16_01965 [Candidatus Sungbacteria bacterium RIFCSPHIGHO2_02_FULL_51_29]OHA06483.1 MAG: hypothetical protein A3B29_05490 [Candidatus Sungbacteria bacterium RIFCSPLOWO2_01_FULL_51_34]OHA12545.1 MAG: hypothetical protein A3I44_00350 [Candidatus Sungbacteria bacterium RIFCSPLOWO2_02_FULL_51_17]
MKRTTKTTPNTTAIILAAGQGTRLRPLTENTPKCLVPIGALPILHHQLTALGKNGVSRVIITVGYLHDKVESYAQGHFPEIHFQFIFNPRFGTTNTLYSLALVARYGRIVGDVLLLNGDVMFDPIILDELLAQDKKKSFLATQMKPCGAEEVKIGMSLHNTVIGLNKHMPPHEALGEAIGINKFSRTFWQLLAKHLEHMKEMHANSYFEDAVECAIADGGEIAPWDTRNFSVIEIDFPKDHAKAEELFSS